MRQTIDHALDVLSKSASENECDSSVIKPMLLPLK